MTEREPNESPTVEPDLTAAPAPKITDTAPEVQSRRERRKQAIRRTLLTGVAFVAGFIVLGILAITVWDWSNSVDFCANVCHDVHPEEIPAFQDSYHARVRCTECHMGRVGTIRNILLKATHFRHLPEVIFDAYDRPLESETMRPPNESCELCHWPPAFHGDTVRQIAEFLPDEENTGLITYLILKTGAGDPMEAEGFGIHWHVALPLEFVTQGENEEEIAWVRATLPDGRTLEWTDVTNPLEEIDKREIQVMDCVDCHNRVGHPFDSPDDLVDEALAEGTLSRDLPYAKREMANLLSATYADQEEALQAVSTVKERYQAQLPDVANTLSAQIEQAEGLAQQLLTRLVFEEPGVTWHDFPNHSEHADFAGCFRCHDGKHLTEDGEPIRLHCNICHSIPVTVGDTDRVPQMPVASVPEPESHVAPRWMFEHRFEATEDACGACHGEIKFGTDNSNFCANYSCHARSWPEVDLDATFSHPIPLEGGHADVWCNDCHEGVRKPEFKCANCHEPPSNHFGPDCEGCHSPQGWQEASLESFVHPIELQGAHAAADCQQCHTGEAQPEYVCANCHEPPPAHFGPSCESCHTPTAFADATLPPELHPIPLIGAHAEASCDDCHVEEGITPEYVCENCHERPENHLEGACDVCHTPEGFAESAERFVRVAPEIPHNVEGREDCLLCHDPERDIQPAPETHDQYINEQCGLCHKMAEQ